MRKDNVTTTVFQLTRELKVPVTRTSVYEEFSKHPDHPSLLAISDVLNQWRIPNGAYQIEPDQLKEIPLPFIAHLKDDGGTFVLIKRIHASKVHLTDAFGKNKTLNLEEFTNSWSGTVLAAEASPNAGETDYPAKRRKEIIEMIRVPFALSAFLLIFLIAFAFHPGYIAAFNWQIALLFLLKLSGIAVSVLLLMHSIDANNPLVQRLCKGGDNRDCNAILSSKAAKLTAELSWSEVGFFYFTGTWLVLLFNSSSVAVVQSLALFNLLCLPYTFYSIYYQFKIAKKWCLLCCSIQALFWLEFLAFLPALLHPLTLPGNREIISIVTCLAVPVLAWVFFKPYLLQSNQVSALKHQLKAFKYNADLFQKTLTSEPHYDLPDENFALTLGNREAETVITMVSNPYCPPCATAHKILDEWLLTEDIQLQIVFSVPDITDDPKTKVAQHFIALSKQGNEPLLKKALHDWYGQKQKDYEAWAKLYPLNGYDSTTIRHNQSEWCNKAAITFTPTIFINGFRLPSLYRLEDIRYFI